MLDPPSHRLHTGGVSRTTSTNRREFVYRVGVAYEFEIGWLVVTPQVHYDYSTGQDAVIYATAFGFKF